MVRSNWIEFWIQPDRLQHELEHSIKSIKDCREFIMNHFLSQISVSKHMEIADRRNQRILKMAALVVVRFGLPLRELLLFEPALLRDPLLLAIYELNNDDLDYRYVATIDGHPKNATPPPPSQDHPFLLRFAKMLVNQHVLYKMLSTTKVISQKQQHQQEIKHNTVYYDDLSQKEAADHLYQCITSLNKEETLLEGTTLHHLNVKENETFHDFTIQLLSQYYLSVSRYDRISEVMAHASTQSTLRQPQYQTLCDFYTENKEMTQHPSFHVWRLIKQEAFQECFDFLLAQLPTFSIKVPTFSMAINTIRHHITTLNDAQMRHLIRFYTFLMDAQMASPSDHDILCFVEETLYDVPHFLQMIHFLLTQGQMNATQLQPLGHVIVQLCYHASHPLLILLVAYLSLPSHFSEDCATKLNQLLERVQTKQRSAILELQESALLEELCLDKKEDFLSFVAKLMSTRGPTSRGRTFSSTDLFQRVVSQKRSKYNERVSSLFERGRMALLNDFCSQSIQQYIHYISLVDASRLANEYSLGVYDVALVDFLKKEGPMDSLASFKVHFDNELPLMDHLTLLFYVVCRRGMSQMDSIFSLLDAYASALSQETVVNEVDPDLEKLHHQVQFMERALTLLQLSPSDSFNPIAFAELLIHVKDERICWDHVHLITASHHAPLLLKISQVLVCILDQLLLKDEPLFAPFYQPFDALASMTLSNPWSSSSQSKTFENLSINVVSYILGAYAKQQWQLGSAPSVPALLTLGVLSFHLHAFLLCVRHVFDALSVESSYFAHFPSSLSNALLDKLLCSFVNLNRFSDALVLLQFYDANGPSNPHLPLQLKLMDNLKSFQPNRLHCIFSLPILELLLSANVVDAQSLDSHPASFLLNMLQNANLNASNHASHFQRFLELHQCLALKTIHKSIT